MLPIVKPGRYVIAVSGGVDSVALLDMIAKQGFDQEHYFVVAHVDHGIREDSGEDLQHVRSLAEKYGLPFASTSLNLGTNASEEIARKARYEFLEQVQKDHNADGIITAHHQDDVIETALINMLRGTNRKGLTALSSNDKRLRPLLDVTKKQITTYAMSNGLVWREDSTNLDSKYTRNAVRQQLMTKLTPLERQHMLARIKHMRELNYEIDCLVANILHIQNGLDILDRRNVYELPFGVCVELFAAWLRRAGVKNLDRKGLHRMVVAAKTYSTGRSFDVNASWYVDINTRSLALVRR